MYCALLCQLLHFKVAIDQVRYVAAHSSAMTKELQAANPAECNACSMEIHPAQSCGGLDMSSGQLDSRLSECSTLQSVNFAEAHPRHDVIAFRMPTLVTE